MKNKIFGLIICALLVAIPVLSACSGGGGTTTGATTSQATSSTTSQTTMSTTQTTTSSTTTSTPVSSTITTTTAGTTSTPTTTTTSTPATTTSPTTTAMTTFSTTGESLEDILGNAEGIDSVYYEMVTTGGGMAPQTSKVWIKGSKMKIETVVEGEKMITVLDDDVHTMKIYYESTGMVMVMNYEEQESALDETEGIIDYNPVILGTETYDGKVCTVVQYTIEGTVTKMWIWKQYGFPIKVEATTSDGTFVIEYKNIVFNSVSDDVFVLPAALTTMTMTF
ncbi:MAG: hypothetical protein PHF74_08310 [Dehalococcoidales bacterium]|nr:hypothetical protein [Dehalococcoidales bacterium]